MPLTNFCFVMARKRNMKKLGMFLILGISVISFAHCDNVQAVQQAMPGKSAPHFTAQDTVGNEVSLSTLTGNGPVLLVFFATWCPPCQHEVPEINSIARTYATRGLQVVAVSVDTNANVLPSFIQEKDIIYPVWHDASGTGARLYGVTSIPTNILISRTGIILYRAHTPPSVKDIEKVLNS